MRYSCKRCGYSTDVKCNLINHFERKKVCRPILEDIDIETLKHKLEYNFNKVNIKINNKVNNTFKCRYCNKVFSHKQSKYLHESKYCKKNEVVKEELKKKLAEAEKVQKENNKIAILEAEMAQKDAEMAQKDAEMAQKEFEITLIKQQMETWLNYTKEEMEKQKEFLMSHIETLMKHAGNTNTDNSITNTDNSITNIDKSTDNSINIHINDFGKEDLSYITDRHFRE